MNSSVAVAPDDDARGPNQAVTFPVLALVVGSALLHASWNLAARKVKGDLAVLVCGMGLGALLSLPPSLLLMPASGSLLPALPFALASAALHIAYVVLLGKMYAHADGAISIVYPTARGSGSRSARRRRDPREGQRRRRSFYDARDASRSVKNPPPGSSLD